MQRSNSYAYSHNMAGQSRYASTHATSSAFSASANPNEDWTKISDLAERRRIQNRTAQRNYRKKLKRRLEDLERRAGSSSASPEQSHSELASTSPGDSHQPEPLMKSRRTSKVASTQEPQQMSPEVLQLDDHSSLFTSAKHLPISSTPSFTYSSYPPTAAYLQQEYQHQPLYQAASNYFGDYQFPSDYSHSLPPTLPSMGQTPYVTKQEQTFGEQDMVNPFSMNYASLAGLEVPTSQAYPSSNSHVNTTNSFSRSTSSPHF